MGITVRQATAADAEFVSMLNGVGVQALHAAAMPERFKPPGKDTFPPAEARALIETPGNLVFLAHADQEPAGYAYAEVMFRPETSLTHASETVYLHHISVAPAFRRAGVGGALMDAVRKAARDAGITLVTLDVWSFNEGARAFFRRHGFEQYVERLWCREQGTHGE